jgi:hypothetical protein
MNKRAPLPIPVNLGGPDMPFREAVDAYVRDHRVTKVET